MIVHTRDLDSISQDPGQQGRKRDLFEDEVFWEALSTITTGNLPLKIMPVDRIFTPYRLREELRELREMKRRHLYAGEEHVFWHEVETIQERLAALKQEPSINVNSSVETLLSIPFAWTHATQEERRDFVKIIFEEVGCDLDAQKIVWVKPQVGYEILFQLIEGLSSMGNNRFDIRDI